MRCPGCGEKNERSTGTPRVGDAFARGGFGLLDLIPGVRDLPKTTKYVIVWVTLPLLFAIIFYVFFSLR
jgi:hypothetical protein